MGTAAGAMHSAECFLSKCSKRSIEASRTLLQSSALLESRSSTIGWAQAPTHGGVPRCTHQQGGGQRLPALVSWCSCMQCQRRPLLARPLCRGTCAGL